MPSPTTVAAFELDRASPGQRARRSAAVDAVVALVAERGVEDLQMRDIAERAGVSLGSLYRYFGSKDHLVAEAFMTWASRLEDRVERRQPRDDGSPADRLSAVLRVGVRPFLRQPQFARMLLAVSTSSDPHASERYLDLGRTIRRVLGQALPELESGRREAVLQVLGSVWYHALVEWVHGRIGVTELLDRLDRACWLLVGTWEERP